MLVLLGAVVLRLPGEGADDVAVPIEGDEAVKAAATTVVVGVREGPLPLGAERPGEYQTPGQEWIWAEFANQPAERRFSMLVGKPGPKYWDLFAAALEEKARALELDADGLRRCLQALNRGRNRETAWWPAHSFESSFITPETTPEEVARMEAKQRREDEAYAERLRYREAHIEEFYVDEDALLIVPVGAYAVQSDRGPGWVIVCKWEYATSNPSGEADKPPATLGHIMIWAMLAETGEVLAYISCD
ncbi:hypothetical protein [Actomonas aquatica]|uniref:Uncharacterized protein n=1 Tax=Actomonas aquatica TaxID=2866162 RepID=A0ABZ1C3R5_9BACT|nr:hypothetical protein [Opitutus sp. WL0086]WRQ86337.1 hypothetical protein K1X11_016095 [Opitutus sp. WL0086]